MRLYIGIYIGDDLVSILVDPSLRAIYDKMRSLGPDMHDARAGSCFADSRASAAKQWRLG